MRGRILAAIVALLIAAPVAAHDVRVRAQDLAVLSCDVGRPRHGVMVLNSSDASTCDPTSTGTTEAHCCCANGTWAACAGSGSGSGDIESVFDCTSGACTDLAPGSGHSLDGGGADAMSPATRSTSLPGTCSEGQQHHDTDSGGSETYVCTASNTWTKLTTASDIVGVSLDLDADGGTDSSGITKVEIDNNFDRLFASEPSADVLRLDATAPIDRWLSPGPSSLGTIGCEFDNSICSYTVVSGTASCAGTVSTTANSAGTEVCDLSSHPGELLIQAGNGTADDVLLRVDATLANNNGIVWKMSGASMGVGNSNQCGVGLNDNDTSPQSGAWVEIILDAQSPGSGQHALMQASGTLAGTTALSDDAYAHVWGALLRIDDGGNQVYWGFVSVNGGTTWHYLGRNTTTATYDNVWVYCDTRASFATGTPAIPVTSVHYIYPIAGTNLYDPF